MSKKSILFFLFSIAFSSATFCQDKKKETKEHKAAYSEFHKEYTAEIKRVKKSSFKIEGTLIDFENGQMCIGDPPGAGIFIFEVKKCKKKNLIGKKVFVQIQCGRGHTKDFYVKDKEFELYITPDQSKYDSHFMDERFKNLNYPEYYCITIEEKK